MTERIAGRFDIERALGAGAMGTVYGARDVGTGARVALKLIAAGSGERFEREARLLRELEHPGIVRYVAHGVSEGRSYLAMEWLEGEDLETRLSKGELSAGRVSLSFGAQPRRSGPRTRAASSTGTSSPQTCFWWRETSAAGQTGSRARSAFAIPAIKKIARARYRGVQAPCHPRFHAVVLDDMIRLS